MSDTSDNKIISAAMADTTFRRRVRLRFIAAAISVTNESAGTTSHANRLAFAGALFANTVDVEMLCMVALANATIRTALLAAPSPEGGNIVDSDIDFQAASVFTGISLSRAW